MPFSQQQLEDAYTQMKQERDAEYQNAVQAAEWLKQQLNFSDCNCWVRHLTVSPVSPFAGEISLQLIHQTYGPYISDYTNRLNSMPYARQLTPVHYEVDTPFGTFKIYFQYWDNHVGGY